MRSVVYICLFVVLLPVSYHIIVNQSTKIIRAITNEPSRVYGVLQRQPEFVTAKTEVKKKLPPLHSKNGTAGIELITELPLSENIISNVGKKLQQFRVGK